VTVSSETIGVWGSADPDDLAVITCAALRAAGVACSIRFKMSGELAVAIELFRGSDRSVLVASFPDSTNRGGRRSDDVGVRTRGHGRLWHNAKRLHARQG